jgi:hypothetical protein
MRHQSSRSGFAGTERHNLGKQIYCFVEDYVHEAVKAHHKASAIGMNQDTMIGATLIAAPSFTLPRPEAERVPEALE